jgi:hypothetical protein
MKSSSPSGTKKLRDSPGGSPKIPIEPLQPLPPNPSSTLLSMSRRPHNLSGKLSQIPQSELKPPTTRPAPSLDTAAPASAQPQQPAAALNDSLSTKTMRNLLQTGPGYRPPLSWSARQAKEKRRKDMLHLQQWIQASVDCYFLRICNFLQNYCHLLNLYSLQTNI